jgi:hypothetical protein
MKKLKILRELPKCDTVHEVIISSGKMTPIDLLDAGLPQNFHL